MLKLLLKDVQVSSFTRNKEVLPLPFQITVVGLNKDTRILKIDTLNEKTEVKEFKTTVDAENAYNACYAQMNQKVGDIPQRWDMPV